MSLIKYDSYKDSGVDWLKTIPEHWEVKRLKDLGHLQNGVSKGGDYFGFGFPFVSYGNIYNDTIVSERIVGLANSSIEEQKHYSVLKGDVFFTRTSETVNEIGIASTCLKTIPTATFSGFTIRFRPLLNTLFSSYSKYLFKTHYKSLFLTSRMNIVTRASLSQGLLNQLPVIIPPFQEQQQIAKYLDQQTKTIDKKISLLKAKAAHYKALKKSLINETVCRGLDKTVTLKDSGIEWIGVIPEHWEVKRLKDNFKLFTGNSISDKSLFEISTNAIPYVSTKDLNISTGKLNYNNGIYIPNENKKFRKTPPNSILVCLEGANAGKKIGFSNQTISFVNKLCAIKSINNNTFDKYLYYFCQSSFFKNQFFELLSGLIGGVSISLLKNLNSITPPLQEQQQIAKYLDEKTSIIDQIITNIQSQIEQLKELRKSLINDVVTGKVRVPEMESVK